MNIGKLYFIRAKETKFGGSEVYLSRFSKALSKNGIEHQIVNSVFPSFLPSWLRAILFNIQVCITKKDKFYFSLDRISCPDVYRAGDGVHRVFLKIKNKSILNPLHPVYLSLEKRCFNNANHIIANSNTVKKEIVNTYHIDPNKISVVYNGIQSKEMHRKESFDKLSSEFPIGEKSKILLYVGSGFERKGVSEFLKIVSMLEYSDVCAFIVGKDKKLNAYRSFSRKLGVNDKVFFTGPREDVDDFYAISHVFILPTYYEPFSNVILEAMNFKNVVFTTKQNGASEILDDSFVMRDPGDLSVAKKVDLLLTDENLLRSEMNKNRTKSKEFSIQRNLDSTLEVISKL